MMQLACYGRLGQDPRSIDTRSGKPMTVATIAVDLPARDSDDAHTLWLGVVAFGRIAEQLAKHTKGETLAISGKAQHNTYRTSDGEAREQLQLVADSLVSARSVRPGGGKRKAPTTTKESESRAETGQPDFDDDIPF